MPFLIMLERKSDWYFQISDTINPLIMKAAYITQLVHEFDKIW